MPKYPAGEHYKVTYWLFECENKHEHRIEISYEYQSKLFAIEIDAWKFLTNEKGIWIDTVFVPKEVRISCLSINHDNYPKIGKNESDFPQWESEWVLKFKNNFNLERELNLRDKLQGFYNYRAFGCHGTSGNSLADMLGGCKGYSSVTDKTCDLCLKEYQSLKKERK